MVTRQLFPGIFVLGRRNLQSELDLNLNKIRAGALLLPVTNVSYFLQVDPSRRFTRIGVNGFFGEDVDLANARVGRGGNVTGFATLRPSVHLTLDLNSAVSWLNVDTGVAARGRLFTAQVQRLKATYNFSPRAFLRLIGQYQNTTRDPSLYGFPVPERSAHLSSSGLFSYKINWQTALFVGYGDDRDRTGDDTLARTGRQVFAKLSYAFQR
jgi:hypothetical protein